MDYFAQKLKHLLEELAAKFLSVVIQGYFSVYFDSKESFFRRHHFDTWLLDSKVIYLFL